MANYTRKKSDKVETERRARIVQEWILKGYSTTDIITQLQNTYNIKRRQAYAYYEKAFELFQETNKQTIEHKKAYHLALRRKLLKDLKEIDTPTGARAALRIADSMARIEGIAVNNQNNFTRNFDDDEIIKDEDGVAILKLPDGTEIEL